MVRDIGWEPEGIRILVKTAMEVVGDEYLSGANAGAGVF